MKTRLFRSFSIELMKIATGIPDDAGIREALADREGEEFLPGGELPSNETKSSQLQKLAISSLIAAQLGSSSPVSKRVNSRGPDSYQDTRDWAITGLKGATGGVGATGLFHSIRDVKNTLTTKQVRRGAGIGAGIALADRAIRQRAERKKDRADKEKAKTKTAGIVSPSPEFASSKTPGQRLRASQMTGSTNGKPKKLGKAFKKPVHLGITKFQMPRLGV